MTLSIVTDTPRDLAQLAIEANKLHAEAEGFYKSWLDRALQVGAVLLEARNQVEYGGWTKWVDENLEFRRHTAAKYLRAWLCREHLQATGTSGGFREVNRLLAGDHVLHLGPQAVMTPQAIALVQKWRAEGQTIVQCAEQLGFSSGLVRKWTTPGALEKERKRSRQHSKQRAVAQRALRDATKEQERKLLLRRGGDTADVYSAIRIALQKAQAVHGKTEDSTNRHDLAQTIGLLHRAEDLVTEVLKRERI